MNREKILVLATRNLDKIREMQSLLKSLPFEVKGLNEFPKIGEIPESGSTFKANAILKAKTVHLALGGFVLADDSGLECHDLGGAPGIYSARYAGIGATDEENNQKLIQELSQIHDPSRSARYVCVLVLIDPKGREKIIEETCEGLITFTPGGTGGFGYDPYFFIPDKKCTMAELPLSEKNKISHRGKALSKIIQYLNKQIS